MRNRQHFYPSEKFKIGHQFTPSDIGKSLATVQSYAQDSNSLQVYFGSGGGGKNEDIVMMTMLVNLTPNSPYGRRASTKYKRNKECCLQLFTNNYVSLTS